MRWRGVELYAQFRIGKKPDDLAAEFGLSVGEVEKRLRVGASYVATHRFIPESPPGNTKPSDPDPPVKPFAVWLYERYRIGKTPEDLARELGIPVERIERRLDAAASYVRSRRRMPNWRS
jgi:hypothetical protein